MVSYDSAEGESGFSNEIRVDIRVDTGLSAPAELSASVEGNTVTIAWDAVADVYGYKLFYGTTAADYIGSVDLGNVTSRVFPNIPDETYYVAMVSYDIAGESVYSNEVAVSVPGATASAAKASQNKEALVPMMSLWKNLYLYGRSQGTMATVKENSAESQGLSLNLGQTMGTYTEKETGSDSYAIHVHDVRSSAGMIIGVVDKPSNFYHETFSVASFFDKEGRVIFNDGAIKRVEPDGTGITTLAASKDFYLFGLFRLSPDREKIVAVEYRYDGAPGEFENYGRVVLMSADGSGGRALYEGDLGEWNRIIWKPDSSGFLFNFQDNYISFDLSTDSPEIADLSRSDIGTGENLYAYTRSGNLLSLTGGGLFDGRTGDLIDDRSDVPSATEFLYGMDRNGEIYFADDSNGSNSRQFRE
jgi:hypothetical protein